MGLKFDNLASWQRWQDSRNRLRRLKARLQGRLDVKPQLRWWVRGTNPELLVVCDSTSPTNYYSLLAPLAGEAVIVHPEGIDLKLDDAWRPATASLTETITRVVSIGDHLPAGNWAHEQARQRQWRQLVVQHGLLTPFSPPPPPEAEVLTWSSADAEFLSVGRKDLNTHVVGSPLLAAAAAKRPAPISRFERPVFLGQLHGAELPRLGMTRATTSFWRETGAYYRPHPREEDKVSRLQHALWRRLGMVFDDARLGARPVVGMFSTGVLEAAAKGVPAWVYYVDPPPWLEEFWERYGLARWGEEPTKVPALTGSPAARIAEFLEGR